MLDQLIVTLRQVQFTLIKKNKKKYSKINYVSKFYKTTQVTLKTKQKIII
jgi:hypothetical protein